MQCRIFYRCVDWNPKLGINTDDPFSRIFYRCVDWNSGIGAKKRQEAVASFTDAWIETFESAPELGKEFSRIFYRCVDWN